MPNLRERRVLELDKPTFPIVIGKDVDVPQAVAGHARFTSEARDNVDGIADSVFAQLKDKLTPDD